MSEYRIVRSRVAVDLDALELPFSNDQARALLVQLGFKILQIDLVEQARSLVGKARYDYQAKSWFAPQRVNCFTFARWVYAQAGIWIPRLSNQQLAFGRAIERRHVAPGDLMLWSRPRSDRYDPSHDHAVGHISIATGGGLMAHAVKKKGTVIETASSDTWREFQGACRIVENSERLITLECPSHFEIDTSDDIKWLLLEEYANIKRVQVSLLKTA